MKTKRYWLRSGLLGFLIGLIVFFGYLPYRIGRDYKDCLAIPGNYHGMCGIGNGFAVAGGIIFWLLITLIFVLVGLIYGKIKNRNKTPQI